MFRFTAETEVKDGAVKHVIATKYIIADPSKAVLVLYVVCLYVGRYW